MKRSYLWLLLLIVLLALVWFVGRAVFNAEITKWQTVRSLNKYEAILSQAAEEARVKQYDRAALTTEGTVQVGCGQRTCQTPSSALQAALRDAGFRFIYRQGDDVYFARDAGFGYDMGLAYFVTPPQFLKSIGRKPFFEARPLRGPWYFYRRA